MPSEEIPEEGYFITSFELLEYNWSENISHFAVTRNRLVRYRVQLHYGTCLGHSFTNGCYDTVQKTGSRFVSHKVP